MNRGGLKYLLLLRDKYISDLLVEVLFLSFPLTIGGIDIARTNNKHNESYIMGVPHLTLTTHACIYL